MKKARRMAGADLNEKARRMAGFLFPAIESAQAGCIA
jgi:hypothetical protein